MAKEKKNNSNAGLVALLICGLITVAIIIGCVFFPDEIFGMFIK